MTRDVCNALTRKLELFGPLSYDDRRLLAEVTTQPRVLESRKDVIREGETPSDVHLILDGFACRYSLLKNGKRQILAYLVPGDFCDLSVCFLKTMDHCIATLSPCSVVSIPRSCIFDLLRWPAIAQALWGATLMENAVMRGWVVNLGQRESVERLAHLICELHLRLQSVGLVGDDSFALPITQADLADTLGMSNVHMNRAIQSLRQQKLIRFRSRILTMLDVERLRDFCGFSPTYLHLEGVDLTTSGSDQTSRPIQSQGGHSHHAISFSLLGERHASLLFRHR